MKAMIVKEFRELARDRRTVAMLIAMPLLLLVVFGYAANFNVSSVRVAVVGPNSVQVSTAAAASSFFDVTSTGVGGDRGDAERTLRDGDADMAIVTGSTPSVLVDGSNLFAAQSVLAHLAQLNSSPNAASAPLPVAPGPGSIQVLYNPDLKTSWVMIPAIIGLILTFIGTIITSLGLVRERETGTIEQLAVMPIKPSAVIVGKIAPYFVLAALDMFIVSVLGVVLFDVPFVGNIAVFALGAALFLFVVLGLGLFISTISQTAGQAIQAAFFVLLPQILLSGMIFPIAAMAAGVRWISYLLPLTYFNNIARGVMLRGAPMSSLWLSFAVLAAMAAFAFTAATLRYRRSLAGEQ
ncbi:MAG: ABC transporter permease [Nostocoides sp.]